MRAAFMLLTRFPAGAGPVTPAEDGARIAWAFPFVGLAVGIVGALAFFVAEAAGTGPVLAALAALAILCLATGALHEDGLADVADGFGGGRDRARKLDIMRDSRVGTYGVLVLVFSAGARVAGLVALARAGEAVDSLVAASILSRMAMVAPMVLLSPARADGLGARHGGATASAAWRAVVAGLSMAVLLLGPFAGTMAGLAAGAAALAVTTLARRQIGGKTGDVLGASQQAAEVAVLVVLVALNGPRPLA